MPSKQPSAIAELQKQLDLAQSKLRTSELLLSLSQRIAGLKNLSEILWTIIETTTETLKADRGSLF